MLPGSSDAPLFDPALASASGRLDIAWRALWLEIKTGGTFNDRDVRQLVRATESAREAGVNVAYVWLYKPNQRIIEEIQHYGAQVFYFFDE